MTESHVEEKTCARSGCTRTIKDHQWAGRNAANKGEDWFEQKDGTVWCPAHHPAWVAGWRAKRAAGVPPEPWRKG